MRRLKLKDWLKQPLSFNGALVLAELPISDLDRATALVAWFKANYNEPLISQIRIEPVYLETKPSPLLPAKTICVLEILLYSVPEGTPRESLPAIQKAVDDYLATIL